MHFHAYLWSGDKALFDKESVRRPPPSAEPTATSPAEVAARYREAVAEWKTTDVPPIETALWLVKPARMVRSTWKHPKEAANWLRERLAEHAPRFSSEQDKDPVRLAVLVTSAAEQLGRGGDVSHGFYLGQPIFLSLALVTCSPNRAEPELSCPLG